MKFRGKKDAAAFSEIVRAHQKIVFSVAYAKVGNVHDAEDVKQEVFVEAWRKFHQLKSPEKVQAWLYAITSNRCKDLFRRKSRRERREMTFIESQIQDVNANADDTQTHEQVLQAVSSLPENIRVVIMLKHLAQLSYQEISRTTGLSKTTIDGRLRTGKKILRQRLLTTKVE